MPCGTFIFGHLEHLNQLAAIAWFPWWMLALWMCVRRPSWRVVAAMARAEECSGWRGIRNR